jgi:lysophospholipase L1-like esterase
MPRRTAGSARTGSARAVLKRGGVLAALLAAGILLASTAQADAAPAAASVAAINVAATGTPATGTPGTAKAVGLGRHGSRPAYYLALGDSLSQGVQPATPPLPPGTTLGQSIETDQGYADDLYGRYARAFPGPLTLEKLGCPGETTTSMLTGTGSPCTYPQGSQLAAAVAFIAAHRSQVKLITIDIGANNVDGCATATAISKTCVAKGLAAVGHDLPLILRALRQAAGKHTVIAGMNLYDPFLADYLTGSTGQTLATASVALDVSLNQLIGASDRAFGVRTADVQDAFRTTDFSDTGSLPGVGTVPVNVARICDWTWMCAASPVGPNIHANAAGYQVIACAFERVIGRLGRRGR